MTFNVAAIDHKLYRSKYMAWPNTAKLAGFAEQIEEANRIMRDCIDQCQITRFTGNLVVPDKALFDGWRGAIPELAQVRSCLEFLRELQYPRNQNSNKPWWMKQSSLNISVVAPEELKLFARDLHECKFFEIFLANIKSHAAAPQFIELGEFLELSAVNDCMLFAWSLRK